MTRPGTQFGYRRHPDQDRPGADAAHYPVVVVGAGPVGLSLAIDLAQRGQRVLLLDDADRIGEGSRAICFSKRSLEYWDRLGVASRMVDKGVVWSTGRIYGEHQLYQFNLLPEDGHKMPAFINLQQYYAEAYLVDQASDCRDRPALAQQGHGARGAQRSYRVGHRDARGPNIASVRPMWWRATGRARRCAAWSAPTSPARCSRTSF